VQANKPLALAEFADPEAVARLDEMIRRRFPAKGKAERIRRARAALKALWKSPIRLSKESIDRIANAPYHEDN